MLSTKLLDTNVILLNLDILNGCKFSCNDCYVDKATDVGLSQDLYKFIDDVSEDYGLGIIGIGSTDFFTASNTKHILNNIVFMDYVNRFDRLRINTTAVKLDLTILKMLGTLDKTMEVIVVVPRNKALKRRYLQRIRENIEIIKSHLMRPVKLILQVNSGVDELGEFQEISDLWMDVFGRTPFLNLSFIRTGGASVEEKINYFKAYYDTIDQSINNNPDVKYGNYYTVATNPNDELHKAFYYYKRKMYIVPVIYAELLMADDLLVFDNYKGYLSRTNDLQVEAIEFVNEKMPECASCNHLALCLIRHVHAVNRTLDHTECFIPKHLYLPRMDDGPNNKAHGAL